jgi:hypothetical protein
MRRIRPILLVVLALLVVSPSASAAEGCGFDLINDWKDTGVIEGTYAPECYAEAFENLPEEAETYSDIVEALEAAQARDAYLGPKGAAPGGASTPGSTGGGTAGGGTSGGGSGGVSGTGGDTPVDSGSGDGDLGALPGAGDPPAGGAPEPADNGAESATAAPAATPAGNDDRGFFSDVILGVGPDEADEVPLPVIVLAVLGALLLAIGAAGLVVQRRSRDLL